MNAEDIKSVDDVSNYIEGCLNDFDEGISTKDETSKYLHELTVRVIEIAQSSPISKESIPSDNEIKKKAKELVSPDKTGRPLLMWKTEAVIQLTEMAKWMRDQMTTTSESEWISIEDKPIPRDIDVWTYQHETVYKSKFISALGDGAMKQVTEHISHWMEYKTPKPPEVKQ